MTPAHAWLAATVLLTAAALISDAGLWRMRDPLARRFLTASLPYLMPAPLPESPVMRLPIDRQPI